MRTTIDLDPVVLATLKQRQKVEGKTLSALVSELLAKALADESAGAAIAVSWPTAPMGARIDIEDKDALWAVLDEH
jgi:hypothetical protein